MHMKGWLRSRCSWRTVRRVLKFTVLGLLSVVLLIAAYYSYRTAVSRRSFSRDWARPSAPATDLMEGRWAGEWKSLGFGDSGEVQCVVTRRNDGEYRGQFLAGHYAIFQSEEGATLIPKKESGKWRLEGSVDLGPEGVHAYTGHVDNAVFFLEWTSALDYGTLTLRRDLQDPTHAVASLR